MIRRLRELISRDDRRRWIALVVVCFGQLMIVLDSTIVNVALPSIQKDLGFGQADLTWVVNAYAISYGGFVLLAGRLGDLWGRKRVFLAGVLLFTLASVVCGLSPAPGALVAARFAQGLGSALSAGVIIAIIVTGFPAAQERAQAMSVFSFTIAGGGSLGLLAGGFLTQAISWHWIFFVNLPIGLATLLAGAAWIEDDAGAGFDQGVDVGGSLLVTSALVLGVYAIVTAAGFGWLSGHTLGFGGAAALLLAGFFWVESRRRNAIVPLRILRIGSLMGASGARVLIAVAMFSTFFLGSLYLQQVRGFSSLGTGVAFLPFTAGLGALSLGITVRLVARFGTFAVLVAGLLCVIAALLMHSSIQPDTPYFPRLFVTYALFGLGAGLAFMPLTLLAMAEVPAGDAGLAAGITNFSLQLGAALGLAVLGTIASQHSRSLLEDGAAVAPALTSGFQLAFAIAAALAAGSLLVVLMSLRPRGPRLTVAVDQEGSVEFQEAA